MTEAKEFRPRGSTRGRGGAFRHGIDAFVRQERRAMRDHPERFEGLKYSKFDVGDGYSSRDTASDAARRGVNRAGQNGHKLDYQVREESGLWWIYYRLDPEAQ